MRGDKQWRALVKDLDWVVDKGPRNVYLQLGDADEAEHPTLAGVIRHVAGERLPPDAGLRDWLINVLRIAIGKLDTRLAQRMYSDKIGTKVPLPSLGCPEQDIAKILYGFKDDDVSEFCDNKSRKDIDRSDRYRTVKSKANLEEHQIVSTQRLIRAIRQDLADVILKLSSQDVPAIVDTKAFAAERDSVGVRTIGRSQTGATTGAMSVDPVPHFIPRKKLFAAINTACQERRKVALVGPSGMGKTQAAKYIAATASREGKTCLYIDATPESMPLSLAQQLRQAGQDISGHDDVARRIQFRELLTSCDAPDYVILDNVVDQRQLEFLIPREAACNVIAMSTLDNSVIPDDYLREPVGPLEEAEGIALIDQLRPDVPRSDAKRLVRMLGGHPLAVEQACSLNLDDTAVRKEFLYELKKYPRHALSAIEFRRQNLVQIYRRQLADIEKQAPEALYILEVVVFLGMYPLSFELVASYFKRRSVRGLGTNLSRDLARRHLDYLADKNLVTFSTSATSGLEITMHVLVRTVLRDRLAVQLEDAGPILHELVLQALFTHYKHFFEDSDSSKTADWWDSIWIMETIHDRFCDYWYDRGCEDKFGRRPGSAFYRHFARAAARDYERDARLGEYYEELEGLRHYRSWRNRQARWHFDDDDDDN